MKDITRQTLPGVRKAPLFILALIVLLLSASCYSPLSKEDGDMSLNISMSRAMTGPTDILAGLLVPSDFEETLKEITRLTAAIVSSAAPATAEDDLTDLLIELALSGTIKFGGSPYFIVEIPDPPGDPEYCTVSGIPSERDYFLYMGSFDDVAELEMFFGLKDEDTGFNADLIPFTNLFYVEGISPEVHNYHGVTLTINNPSSIFDVPGWYFLDVWSDDGDSAVSADIVAKASQPFRVETGKSTAVEVHLVKAPE
jgi:hypothetical protein